MFKGHNITFAYDEWMCMELKQQYIYIGFIWEFNPKTSGISWDFPTNICWNKPTDMMKAFIQKWERGLQFLTIWMWNILKNHGVENHWVEQASKFSEASMDRQNVKIHGWDHEPQQGWNHASAGQSRVSADHTGGWAQWLGHWVDFVDRDDPWSWHMVIQYWQY